MDLFQLERSILALERKFYGSSDTIVKPFLGVSNFDGGQAMFEDVKKLKECIADKDCSCSVFFFIANTTLSTQMSGEHWFLISFDSLIENVFNIFNSFGVSNTVKTFGYVNKCVEKIDNYANSKERQAAVRDLAESIWGRRFTNLPAIVDIDGVHQDFSTDECGYHVMRFVISMYDHKRPVRRWENFLSLYLIENDVTVVPFHDLKYANKNIVQPILLKNDRRVKRFIERGDKTVEPGDRIQEHDEYKLSSREWQVHAVEHAATLTEIHNSESLWQTNTSNRNVVELRHKTNIMVRTKKTDRKRDRLAVKKRKKRSSSKIMKKKHQITTEAPEINLTTYADNFSSMVEKSRLSKSKRIMEEFFPSQVKTRELDPITNNILYSGMLEDPNYLENTTISLPGQEDNPISVRDYFKKRNVDLDSEDPYTYKLARLVKDYFQNHEQKKLAERVLRKNRVQSNLRWRYVK